MPPIPPCPTTIVILLLPPSIALVISTIAAEPEPPPAPVKSRFPLRYSPAFPPSPPDAKVILFENIAPYFEFAFLPFISLPIPEAFPPD